MGLKVQLYKGARGSRFYIVGSVNGERVNRATEFGPSERAKAKLRAAEVEREILAKAIGKDDPTKPIASLETALDLYLKKTGGVGATTASYVKRFVAANKSKEVFDVKPADVMAFCASTTKAAGTVRREINAIQGFLNFAREAHGHEAIRVRKPKDGEAKSTKFTAEQRDLLLTTCSRNWNWFMPHLLFYFFTGLRRSELCKLKWEDILYERRVPKVMLVRSRKGARGTVITRRVPIHEILVPVLMSLPRHPDGYIFRTATGLPIRWPMMINRTFNEIVQACGLPHLTPHDARRTFASMLIAGEVSDYRITDLLGHIDTKMLKVYAIIEDPLRASAVSIIPSPRGVGHVDMTEASL